MMLKDEEEDSLHLSACFIEEGSAGRIYRNRDWVCPQNVGKFRSIIAYHRPGDEIEVSS